ncbi:MAG TPA: hypothetical protein VGL35_07990 [Rhizomicrobium sp.]|jgi:hypothetical protein
MPLSAEFAAGRATGRWRLPFLELVLANIRGEAAAVAILVPLLLVPVFWNGFPIIYYDTGAYILEGLGLHFLPERSPVYSLFLRFGGAGITLWSIVFIQAVLVAFLVVETARALAPRLPVAMFALVGAFLVIATGLPWYVGQIEPDCFTALVVLALYLLAFQSGKLGWWRRMLVIVAGGFAVGVHPSHLVLAAFLWLAIVAARALRRITRAGLNMPRPRLVGPALVGLFGLVLVLSSNYAFTRQLFVSRAGASFVFARMLQDGLVMKLLEASCPKSGYTLCAYRDSLPATADGWLWTPHSPFFRLGHFDGTAKESARIVRDAILRYPLLQLRAGAIDSAEQFFRFGTGDQIEPQEWVLSPIFRRLLPSQFTAYLSARQQQGEMRFRLLSLWHVLVASFSLAGVAILLVWFLRAGQFEAAAFGGFVLAALIGNAVICGVLSGPHDRYQSRLVWLAPFVLLVGNPRVRMACGAKPNPARSGA